MPKWQIQGFEGGSETDLDEVVTGSERQIRTLLERLVARHLSDSEIIDALQSGTYFNVMYAKGQGVPQDYAQAVVWYRKAAEQGDADAQTLVGVMYANGHGVSQDYTQALIWYRKAAEQGNALAQLGLGLIYANGHGVPQDYVRAHMWFNIAAEAAGASDA